MDFEKWNPEKLQIFEDWMNGGFRKDPPPVRIRKSLKEVIANKDEFDLLKKAFEGIMIRDPNDMKSYYHLASIHGLPMGNLYCEHHDEMFLVWHRMYSLAFEDALRSVEGCENVTLPYWDQYEDQGVPPPEMYEYPFDRYIYQKDIEGTPDTGNRGPNDPVHKFTFRVTRDDVISIYADRRKDMVNSISIAMESKTWRELFSYNGIVSPLEHSHDLAHNILGGGPSRAGDGTPHSINPETKKNEYAEMLFPEFTGYGPMFWFTHSYYDKLFSDWQIKNNLTSMKKMREHLISVGSEFALTQLIQPWTFRHGWWDDMNFARLVDGFGVQYTAGAIIVPPVKTKLTPNVNLMAVDKTKLEPKHTGYVLKINRLNRSKVIGSFFLVASQDGLELGYVYFFQNSSGKCYNCMKHPVVSLQINLNQYYRHDYHIDVKIYDKQSQEIPWSKVGLRNGSFEVTEPKED